MYFHNVVGTGRYTTSTTNMYNKDRFHVLEAALRIAATQRYRPKTPGFYRCVLYADQIKGCQRLKKKIIVVCQKRNMLEKERVSGK